MHLHKRIRTLYHCLFTIYIHKTCCRSSLSDTVTMFLFSSSSLQHKAYQRLFTNLSFVVLDEAHTYTGAFGIHVAGVLRRLIRIALAYRSRLPQFVLCSATLHNARDLMCKLLPLEAFALPYPSPQHLHMNKPGAILISIIFCLNSHHIGMNLLIPCCPFPLYQCR